MHSKTFTLIGARAAPDNVLEMARDLGYHLGRAGHRMRSGAADGMDRAFEDGFLAANGDVELHLPFKGYNGSKSQLHKVPAQARELAQQRYIGWEDASEKLRLILASCCAQTLGADLDSPSDALICWTKDGCESWQGHSRATGGTSVALLLAVDKGIPVFNLKNQASRARLNAVLRDIGISYQVPVEAQALKQDSLF